MGATETVNRITPATNERIITHEQLVEIYHYERPGDLERAMRAEGVVPFHGKGGTLFAFVDQFLAARGILDKNDNDKDWL